MNWCSIDLSKIRPGWVKKSREIRETIFHCHTVGTMMRPICFMQGQTVPCWLTDFKALRSCYVPPTLIMGAAGGLMLLWDRNSRFIYLFFYFFFTQGCSLIYTGRIQRTQIMRWIRQHIDATFSPLQIMTCTTSVHPVWCTLMAGMLWFQGCSLSQMSASFHVLLKHQIFSLFALKTCANPHGNRSLWSVRPQITFFGNKPLAQALFCTKQAKWFPPYFINTFMKVGFSFP